MKWHIAGGGELAWGERTLVMAILNVTPDSFSDGGKFNDVGRAVARAEEMIAEGADIIDLGGESTRPGAAPVTIDEEIARVVPVIEELAKRVRVPISVDTTKRAVARAAISAGAQIINDISGLRFEPALADEAASAGAGLILMHSRGTATSLHLQSAVDDIFSDVAASLRTSISEAERRGVRHESIALDPGFGFGKTHEQNVELLARLDEIISNEFANFPLLVGTSRKRFIGRLLGDAPIDGRLHGTTASVAAAALAGANIVRVHDVRAASETLRVADALRRARKSRQLLPAV